LLLFQLYLLAGGGGCGIIIARDNETNLVDLENEIREHGMTLMKATLGGNGVTFKYTKNVVD
jgi:mevalonate kinase